MGKQIQKHLMSSYVSGTILHFLNVLAHLLLTIFQEWYGACYRSNITDDETEAHSDLWFLSLPLYPNHQNFSVHCLSYDRVCHHRCDWYSCRFLLDNHCTLWTGLLISTILHQQQDQIIESYFVADKPSMKSPELRSNSSKWFSKLPSTWLQFLFWILSLFNI